MADKNEFDDAASSVMQGQATAIRNNIYNAVPQNPATVAQHSQIAGTLGVPLESVQSDPAAAKQQASMRAFDANKVVNQYPHLAEFLTDPTNAAKSHTDLPTLAATEQSVKNLPKPAPASAAPNLEAEKPATVGGWMSDNIKSIPDLPMAAAQGLGGSFNSAAKAVNLVLGGFPTLYDKAASLITGKDSTSASDAYFKNFVAPLDERANAFNLSPNAAFLPKLTHGVGSLVGTLSQIALTGGMSEAPAAAGVVDAAAPALTKVAEAVGHATKSMAFPSITAAVNTGNDVYANTGSLAAAVKAATAAYATNTAMGVMPLSLEGGALKRVATGFPIGVVTGEANRSVTNASLPGNMQQPAGVEDAIINGLTGSMLAGAMGHTPLPHETAVREMYEANRKAEQANQGMQGLQALGELAAKSELRKNDPQAFKDFVNKVTDDGHLPEVWIDGKTLEGALNQAGIAREELAAKMPELAAQMHEASETGGDVKIDTADFAANIAGTPIEAAILPHLKTDPDGMTFQEGQDHLAQSQKDMTVQAQDLADKQAALDERTTQLKAITDDVQSQLQATGRFPADVAKQYAALHGAFYDNMSERMGITPAEMRERMPLSIKAEGSDGFNQTATVRAGKETLEKYGLNPEGKYSTREIASALEARQRDKYGTIAPTDRSPEASDKIANWMAEEVRFEMQHPRKSGVGWYSAKFQRALDRFGDVFPELKKDKDARGVMTALIAITSDGQKVVPNFRQAVDLYKNFRETGKFSTDIGHQRQASIDNNVAILQDLHGRMGAKDMRKYLLQEATVSELRQIAKAEGVEFKTDYQAHIKLPMAAVVFGPKLGAFYANLMGAHGYLTMDRWWSRTFNRYRGTLLQAPTAEGLARIKELNGHPEWSDDQAMSATVGPRNSYAAKGFKDGTELEKASNTVYKAAFENLEDTPFNAKDRTFMLDAVAKAQQVLAAEGRKITVADIQAVLWYYEKRLYGELGARQTADVSYEEAAQRVATEHQSASDSAGGRPAPGDGSTQGEAGADGVPGQAAEGSAAEPGLDAFEPNAGQRGELDDANTLKQAGAGDGGGRGEGRNLTPLEGAPSVAGFHGPDPRVVSVAEQYARDHGITLKRQAEYARVDPERAKRLAAAYEAMPHAPQDAKVKEAYENLVKQTTDQYQALADAGYKFWFIDLNNADNAKYASTPWNAMRDMRANQEMGVFPTNEGFGSGAEFSPDANPLLADTGIKWPVGGPDGPLAPVLANDLFRAVHDAFGHGLEGAGFRAEGEENAWQAHSRLFTGSAVGAITSETRGQNSWLNYGPHGESNRTAQVEDTRFADQKTGLMPEWAWTEGRVADAVAQTDTPKFKAWFGDSKAVDDQGQPQMMYHATNADFDKFNPNFRGAHFVTPDAEFANDHLDNSGTTDLEEGANVMPVYVRAEKPFDYENPEQVAQVIAHLQSTGLFRGVQPGFFEGGRWDSIEDRQVQRAIKALGYDSFYVSEGGVKNLGVYDSAQIKSATGNNGEFDPKNPSVLRQGEGNRGSYNPATGELGLLKNADLSTFLHESGHFFLEAMHDLAKSPEAPEGLKTDFDTLLQDFKVEGATPEERMANWSARDLEGKREGHEQFAEGFEDYLMSGKAPTPELQSMFSRFRSWLMSVYQSLRDEVSPEVKGVMDRMFASQEAITEAERVRAYAIPDLTGETGPLVDQYKALGAEATEAAIAEMQARSLRDMKWLSNAKSRAMHDLQRSAKAERDKITAEVTKEVMDTPVNKARTWLTKGETTAPNGDVIKVDKGFKLNTDAVREMFPKGELGSPDAVAELKGMTNKEGLHPDLVAEMFGFNSGKELIGALTSGEKASETIKGLTDQRMLERHGDLVDPVSVERAAEAAIHNEARAKMMATGLKLLTKSPMSVAEINKAAKAAADTAIAAKAVGELRPAQYSAAEAKANKELLKLAPKDPAGASQAQRAALLNNRLFKSASEAVADVQKGLTYLKRLQRPAVRGKIDIDVRDQIDAILARFDLRANPTDTPTRAQVNLEKWIESQAAAGYSPTVTPEMLATEYRKPYREMSVEEFRGMVDTIKSMEHMGKERNTLTINGEKHQLAEYVATKLVPKLQERGDNFSVEELYTSPEDRALNPMRLALDKLGSWMRGLNAQLKPQEFKRNAFDVHELLGPFGESLFDPVMNANYNKVRWLKGLSDDFRAKAADLGKDWQKGLLDMLPNDKLIDAIASKEAGTPVFMKLTRGKMVGLAVHVGNESNFDKLTKGYGWQPEAVWQFLHDNMTAKDWSAVQSVWDLYEKHWPDMAAMYRRLGQTTPDKIEARAFHTPFGEMRGGYAAIKYDPLRSRRGEKDAAGQAINPGEGLFGKDYFSRTATTNGSMNKRIDGYTDAIDLNFHTIERSLQESIHDLAYREALINANKIVENGEFRKAFFKAYGREDYRAIQDWIGRIANSDNSDRNVGALGRFLSYTRTGMVMTAIALRATTVLKHGGSAGIKTMAYFAGGGEKYLASRMASMGSDYTNQIESAKEKFGEINARLLQQDRDYRATASSLFEPESIQSQAERFGHSAVAWADMMTAVPTAWAAYDRAIAEGIPKRQGGTGLPMTEAQAVAYANKVVREAHGSNVESARSNVMTAPSEGVKMFTTLYGFMNNSYGQMADSINKFGTPGLGKPEILARTMGAIIVPALWAAYLSEGHKDGESWAGWVAKAITGEVAGMVPLVRDAWSMAEGFSHAGVIGAESWMSTMVHAGKDVVKLAQGQPVNKPISDIADAVGMGLHIPGMGQIGKTAQNIADVQSGKQPAPANPLNYLTGLPKH